jgi:hypothetical protein
LLRVDESVRKIHPVRSSWNEEWLTNCPRQARSLCARLARGGPTSPMSAFGEPRCRSLWPRSARNSQAAPSGRKRNDGFRDRESGKLPSLGMDPAGLFRPVSLVQIRPECANSSRAAVRRELACDAPKFTREDARRQVYSTPNGDNLTQEAGERGYRVVGGYGCGSRRC